MSAGEGYLKNLQQILSKRLKNQLSASFFSGTPHRLCHAGESTTLLPEATHIDIAFAMTLWILRRGTSGREYRRRMTLKAEAENTLSPRPQHQPETSSLALSVSSFAEDPEWYIRFTNIQQTLIQCLQYQSFSGLSRESCVNILLLNNKANLLTRLVPCWNRILCTRHRMTGAGSAGLVPPAEHLPLTRSVAPTSPARGEVV